MPPCLPPDSRSSSVLSQQLGRWTDAGLIDAPTAARIRSAEQDWATSAPARADDRAEDRTADRAAQAQRRALPLIAEVLGYAGAAIAITAGFIVIKQLWPKVPAPASLTFTAVVAVALIAVGSVLRTRGEPALGRLRSVLWLVATVAAGGFVAVLTNQVLKTGTGSARVLDAAGWTACAIPLWWRSRSAVQHLALFAGVVTLAGTVLYEVVPSVSVTGLGVEIWIVSAMWGLAAYRGYLVPAVAGLAAARPAS